MFMSSDKDKGKKLKRKISAPADTLTHFKVLSTLVQGVLVIVDKWYNKYIYKCTGKSVDTYIVIQIYQDLARGRETLKIRGNYDPQKEFISIPQWWANNMVAPPVNVGHPTTGSSPVKLLIIRAVGTFLWCSSIKTIIVIIIIKTSVK